MSSQPKDQNLEEILEEFQCPICFNYMLPPIRTCLQGHSICNRCDKKLSICAFCRCNKSDARNFGMENIIGKLILPCKNTGCSVKLHGHKLLYHQNRCEYKITFCPLKTVSNCVWKGPYIDIIGHCLEKHPKNAYDSNMMYLLYTRYQNGQIKRPLDSGDSYHMIFRAHGELFKFMWDINTCNGYMRWCVIYLGHKENAAKYYFEVMFQNVQYPSRNMPVYIRATCQQVHPVNLDNTKIMLSHINKLQKFSGARGLFYTVTICKYAEGEKRIPNIPVIINRKVLKKRAFVIPEPSLFFNMSNTDDVKALFEFQEESDDDENF